ncbi:hypothetical protein [Flavihumibacter petaseus]|uniref:Lipocalin-like domain-containing protein n=1 Tax=Flavihumibacter petaseus NBRC 106054 TaxID=1220578 RepID=A0A0E9N1E6_9BACT|nr:hypothetical protein [Flavihumibacter petaseus]GAO43669.1 hypothetical protein FPE01S_02_07750 [Flavihumibacter petaseus NBRC 106054]
MKLLFLPLLFLITTVQAQDCALQKGTDDFSGQPKLFTGFMELQDVQLNIEANAKEIDYFFVIQNSAANCIGEASEALFVFEGGKQKMTLRNTGGDNCNGYFHILMKGGMYTPTPLQRLSAKKVVSITFSDRNDKKTVVALSTDQQELLMKVSACIARDAKTLVK